MYTRFVFKTKIVTKYLHLFCTPQNMLKKTIFIIVSVGCILAAWIIIRYLNPPTTNLSTNIKNIDNTEEQYVIQTVATGLQIPRSIVFTSPTRMLVTERPWTIRQIVDGILQQQPLISIPNISSQSEEWLMSITLDPAYNSNKYVYISYAYMDSETMYLRISRWTDRGNTMTDEYILIDKLPAAQRHAWSAIAFGPDQKLYITVGDAIQGEKAQFIDYYNGKILRINKDWSTPEDNPRPRSLVRSYGHRNSQWIDRDDQWNMYASEHGPSIFDGPPGWDEINLIQAKNNYGRNKVSHEDTMTGAIAPIALFTPAIAPWALHIYKGNMFPERKNKMLVAMLKGEWILLITIDAKDPTKIIQQQKIADTYGRIRNITTGPDGAIYFTTSNTDGRGRIQENDDKIFKITRP